jgi:hypothetical protein
LAIDAAPVGPALFLAQVEHAVPAGGRRLGQEALGALQVGGRGSIIRPFGVELPEELGRPFPVLIVVDPVSRFPVAETRLFSHRFRANFI